MQLVVRQGLVSLHLHRPGVRREGVGLYGLVLIDHRPRAEVSMSAKPRGRKDQDTRSV